MFFRIFQMFFLKFIFLVHKINAQKILVGNAIMTLKAKDGVKVITVRGTAFEAARLMGEVLPLKRLQMPQFNADISSFVKQELTKSDRPELTSAKIVVSGGIF